MTDFGTPRGGDSLAFKFLELASPSRDRHDDNRNGGGPRDLVGDAAEEPASDTGLAVTRATDGADSTIC